MAAARRTFDPVGCGYGQQMQLASAKTEAPPATVHPVKPPRSLLVATGRAIGDYAMIRPGDRVLLGLSGGKDSLCLLHVLLHLASKSPVRFELGAATVDPQSPDYFPAPLKPYMQALGVPYFVESYPVVKQAETSMRGDSFCAFCARLRRGMLYGAARREGYNVLALAQHLDDLAETFLMSAFYGGRLRTMQAHYTNDDGDLRIIRPFVYVRERQTAAFAKAAALPVIMENCPACFSRPTARYSMKQKLAALEADNGKLFNNLRTALKPLMGGIPGALKGNVTCGTTPVGDIVKADTQPGDPF
ncbi:MAG: tRNA 2-thiocytidine(32) synthetase TtcA [Proteobacteria bacterium]|nr:tRNA 2-thiocytidine(32) synthetase TtcA [Pseudomonadota bacterium]